MIRLTFVLTNMNTHIYIYIYMYMWLPENRRNKDFGRRLSMTFTFMRKGRSWLPPTCYHPLHKASGLTDPKAQASGTCEDLILEALKVEA